MRSIALARAAFAAAVLSCGAGPVIAEDLTGSVVAVKSGDTLVVSSQGRDVEVRLADIYAPQGSDFYAPAARTLLDSLVSGKTVRVAITGRSGPDRVFGRVHAGDIDFNLMLVQRGAAWMCLEYAANTDLLPWQNQAQRRQLGLWLNNPLSVDQRADCKRRPPAERPVSSS